MYIQISHLSKSHGGQEVLLDVSFTLGEREHVGLLGSNGSGKSTLLKLIAGQLEPDGGLLKLQPSEAKIGYLPQTQANGLQTRQALHHLLDTHPDMLLLDEPTNHLDTASLEWLHHLVTRFPGPVLLISHDRYFLDHTVTRVLELDHGRLTAYGGNYTFYQAQKQLQTAGQLRMYADQQTRLTKLATRAQVIKSRTQQVEYATTGTDHYVRRKAAKAARSALALEKRIDHELSQTPLVKPETLPTLRALFTPIIESGQTVVRSPLILRSERIALVGPNGSGKTTLIKRIISSPSLGTNVSIGYLSQEHQELTTNQSVFDFLSLDQTLAYQLLKRFLLASDKLHQPVNTLSSGEQSKLLLAKIMSSGANFIILDEPTNHLDIPSRLALESALANYTGTLLVVSHDKYFLDALGITRILRTTSVGLSGSILGPSCP